MNVLSLFDGISCARVSLDRAGIEVNAYMSAEIDKNAIKVSEKNYPDIIRVGNVVGLEVEGQIDLLIGGSPCQDLSIAKKDRKGLEGDRSSLFWEYVRIKKECTPKWFILENVASMPKADKDIITREMGVEPVMFNASLVSAQSRKRLFWTNIRFDLPVDRGILLKDILEADVDEKFYVKKTMNLSTHQKVNLRETDEKAHTLCSTMHKGSHANGTTLIKVGYVGGDMQGNRVYSTEGKATTLSADGGGLAGGTTLIKEEARIRKLTPIECERLQGLPDNYTEGVATTNRYKCLGNAFHVDVVAHILSGVKNE
jgi:DNA-cytosine methyltransferase